MEIGERVKGRPFKGILMGVVLTIFIIFGIIGTITGELYAAEYLGKIDTSALNAGSLGRLAVGPDGAIYVADGMKNHILKFDKTWRYLGDIPYEGVSAVEVAQDGTLYIGRNKNASVAVYKNNSINGYIGAGELKSVNDIGVDALTGDIYVVDNKANLVRIYDTSGNSKGALSGLYMPVGVAIAGDEVYVIDTPLVDDPSNSGTKTTGARVSVFDRSGNLLRSFEDWEGNGGHLFRPQDIEVDSSGNIYIPDGYFLSVVQYDSVGNYLGEIKSSTEQMLIPRSVALSPDENRLYVSSNTTKSILVFALDGTVGMQVSPLSMSFTAQVSTAPAKQGLNITNTGTGAMNYVVEPSDSWITVDTGSGTLAGGATATVMVGINTVGLNEGLYNGSITVRNDAGAMETVSVILEVKAPPKLVVNPQSLIFDYTIGDTLPANQPITIAIENDPAGAYSWSVSSKDSWINITVSSGSGDTLTQALVGVDVTGFVAGTYTGQIVIDAPGVEGSPAVITVTLNVYSIGSIHVTSNITEASFTIEGPGGVTYTGSGMDWSISNVADGTYTIVYNDVSGYKTPASETKTLSGGGTLEFNGVYEKVQSAAASIVLSREKGKKSESTVMILDGNGNIISKFPVLGNISGGVDTAIADVDGDGVNEIIAGQLRGGTTVGVYRTDGTEIVRFSAYHEDDDEGVSVAGGDLDGDGRAEIIVLSGDDEKEVKIFSYDGTSVLSTGIGANHMEVKAVDTGDMEGDGLFELVMLEKGSHKSGSAVSIWSLQTGKKKKKSEFATGIKHVKDIGVGDVDGDMIDDIAVSTKSKVYIYNLDGDVLGVINTGKDVKSVDIGDLDGDGTGEIVVGKKGIVKIYSGTGMELMTLNVFDKKTGVRVSTGDLGI